MILAPMLIVWLIKTAIPMVISNFPIVAVKPPLLIESIAASETVQDEKISLFNTIADIHVYSTAQT